MLFPASFDMLMKARSGTVFHKSPDFFLLKEKNVSRLFNDYCSTCCRVRRGFKTTLSGRSSGRALIKKMLVGNFEIGRDEKGFFEKILPKMRFYLS